MDNVCPSLVWWLYTLVVCSLLFRRCMSSYAEALQRGLKYKLKYKRPAFVRSLCTRFVCQHISTQCCCHKFDKRRSFSVCTRGSRMMSLKVIKRGPYKIGFLTHLTWLTSTTGMVYIEESKCSNEESIVLYTVYSISNGM